MGSGRVNFLSIEVRIALLVRRTTDYNCSKEDFGVCSVNWCFSHIMCAEELDGIKKSTTTHTVHDN